MADWRDEAACKGHTPSCRPEGRGVSLIDDQPWVAPTLAQVRRRLITSGGVESLRRMDRMSEPELLILASQEVA